MTEDDSYLVCPKCRERLNALCETGKIIVTCDFCDYRGFEIVGLTQRFLRQFNSESGRVRIGEREKEGD